MSTEPRPRSSRETPRPQAESQGAGGKPAVEWIAAVTESKKRTGMLQRAIRIVFVLWPSFAFGLEGKLEISSQLDISSAPNNVKLFLSRLEGVGNSTLKFVGYNSAYGVSLRIYRIENSALCKNNYCQTYLSYSLDGSDAEHSFFLSATDVVATHDENLPQYVYGRIGMETMQGEVFISFTDMGPIFGF